MDKIYISVKNDFSEFPGLRYCEHSDDSGEEFYHTMLNSKFKEAIDGNKKLVVNLDHTIGYAVSFLDEAFGKLVFDFTYEKVDQHLDIISEEEPHWILHLYQETFVNWEKRRKKNDEPKVTQSHEPWYRLVNGKIDLKKWA